jgi:hypothetical protein
VPARRRERLLDVIVKVDHASHEQVVRAANRSKSTPAETFSGIAHWALIQEGEVT